MNEIEKLQRKLDLAERELYLANERIEKLETELANSNRQLHSAWDHLEMAEMHGFEY